MLACWCWSLTSSRRLIRCWETINDKPWWIIKTPILITILVSVAHVFVCSLSDSAYQSHLLSPLTGELHPLHLHNPHFAAENELPRYWKKGIQSVLVGDLVSNKSIYVGLINSDSSQSQHWLSGTNLLFACSASGDWPNPHCCSFLSLG